MRFSPWLQGKTAIILSSLKNRQKRIFFYNFPFKRLLKNSQRIKDEKKGEVCGGGDPEVFLVDRRVADDDADDEGHEVAQKGPRQVPGKKRNFILFFHLKI
jgi:hypothetical protein